MEHFIANSICSLGLGLSVLISLVLFSKNKTYLFFLGLLFAGIALQLAEEFLLINGLLSQLVHFTETTEWSIYILAPCFYLFAKYQVEEPFQQTDLLHFLPAILVAINFMPLYFSAEAVKVCYVMDQLNDAVDEACELRLAQSRLFFLAEKYLDLLNVVQIIVYIWLSIPLLKQIPDFKTKKLSADYLNWSRSLFILAALAVFAVVIDQLWVDARYDTFSILYLTLICSYTCFYLLNKSLLLQENLRTASYEGIEDAEVQSIYEEVLAYLQLNENFTNSKLTAGAVAQALTIPRNKIQIAFNKLDKDFKTELNQLRINKAKVLLGADQQFTIEAIGEMVGYLSKGTFYKYFKQFEGQRPSEFLKSI